MITSPFRIDFYASRFTERDLAFLSQMSSQAIYVLGEIGRPTDLHRWIFDEVVREMSRRGDLKEGHIVEPTPLKLPDWLGETLTDATLQASAITYLSLSPACADFADWLCQRLMHRTIAYIKNLESLLYSQPREPQDHV